MIIHTKKYKHFDKGAITNAKSASKNIKVTTESRKDFLAKIRTKEAKNKEQSLNRIPYNRLSDFFGVAGIYFLLNGYKVVYVGETSCLMSRLGQHKLDKEFDGFRFLREPNPSERLRLEKAYIQKYSPIYNVMHNPDIGNPKPLIRIKEDFSNY